jgi:hypothetical protein
MGRQSATSVSTVLCEQPPYSEQLEHAFHAKFALAEGTGIRSSCVFPCFVCPRQGTDQILATRQVQLAAEMPIRSTLRRRLVQARRIGRKYRPAGALVRSSWPGQASQDDRRLRLRSCGWRRYCRAMRFGILGPLTVADGERSIVVPGAKPRVLLVLLVLHAGGVRRPAC